MSDKSGVDARGYLSAWANTMSSMTVKDIMALSEEQWTAAHGGCSQSASAATVDIIGRLQWSTEALKGNVIIFFGNFVSQQIKDDCATREGAAASLSASVEAFCAALLAASDDSLNAEVMPPWQVPAPLFMVAQIATSHIWYHDGQINYIQTLLGDDKVHWMDS